MDQGGTTEDQKYRVQVQFECQAIGLAVGLDVQGRIMGRHEKGV